MRFSQIKLYLVFRFGWFYLKIPSELYPTNLAITTNLINPVLSDKFLIFCYKLYPYDFQYQGKWSICWAEAMNKTLIKINKSKENLNVLNWSMLKPIFNHFYLLVFYANFLQRYNMAKKSHFILMKLRFL